MTTTPSRRIGRPGKGARRVMTFRLAEHKADIVRELANAEGYEYVSDYLAQLVAEHLDSVAHADPKKVRRQDELPLGRLAS